MAKHAGITTALGTHVYFCDPASPWQRGSNENANGLLRQYFPKGLDLNTIDAADLRQAVDDLNDRPRAVLGWASAATKFASLQAAAALQLASVSAPTGSLSNQVPRVPLPTNGDNPQRLSTAPAARGATPTAPQLSRG